MFLLFKGNDKAISILQNVIKDHKGNDGSKEGAGQLKRDKI